MLLYGSYEMLMKDCVPVEKDGILLSQYLMQTFAEKPMWAIKEVLKKRDVRINGVRTEGDIRVYAGQEVRVFWPKSVISKGVQKKVLPLPEVVFEDEHVLLINKPQGIPSQHEDQPLVGDSALTRVLAYLEAKGETTEQVHLCHRLDVQTGGLLMLVKDDASFESAMQGFSERTFRKFYTCRVKGCPTQKAMIMDAWLRKDSQIARVSVTDHPARGAVTITTGYRVLKNTENAWLEVELITGRTHQIRAHLAHIGHPILGDDKYGDRALNRTLNIRRQQLWATRLEIHAEGALSYLDGQVYTVQPDFCTERER